MSSSLPGSIVEFLDSERLSFFFFFANRRKDLVVSSLPRLLCRENPGHAEGLPKYHWHFAVIRSIWYAIPCASPSPSPPSLFWFLFLRSAPSHLLLSHLAMLLMTFPGALSFQ